MENKKEAIGKIAIDLVKNEDYNPDLLEQARSMLENYDKHILAAVDDGKKQYGGNFFVVVSVKQERLLKNVIRSYFYVRQTCPHPVYDQTVYFYNARQDSIDILWVLPDKKTCQWYRDHPFDIETARRDLLMDILSFYDGSLGKKQIMMNNLIKEDTRSQSFKKYINEDVDNHITIA